MPSFDFTLRTQDELQRRLVTLKNGHKLSREICDRIRPSGSQRPRMYGLPKVHKTDVPVRPILSMIGSVHYELAKWLSEILNPVLSLYSSYCIPDSFFFSKFVQEIECTYETSFMCSFDVESLYTNVPLDETIAICADALYRGNLKSPPFSENIFIELMNRATKGVEFSFNNTMYKQIDGVAMGSPLGASMANIFVGFYEKVLFQKTSHPFCYFRYVDDTFVMIRSKADAISFFNLLNSLHPSLRFTMESENNGCLSFLDVFVQRSLEEGKFLTRIYRKPTFTGLYINWDSFAPRSRKINLIKTLTHRALKICSAPFLTAELEYITDVLIKNGYPKYIVTDTIAKKVIDFHRPKFFGPSRCPVYIKLPFLGTRSCTFADSIKKYVTSCYFSVEPRVVFKTKTAFPSFVKDSLPTNQTNNVIYLFKCRCDASYVGRTSLRLERRILQHVSNPMRKHISEGTSGTSEIVPSSSIGAHIWDDVNCGKNYSDDMFSILHRASTEHQLRVLEAICISIRKPSLCLQRDFSNTLKLIVDPH